MFASILSEVIGRFRMHLSASRRVQLLKNKTSEDICLSVPRILYLIPTLDRSGAEKQLALLATGLPRVEFDLEVVALTRGGPYAEPIRDAGIRLTMIGKRWRFDPLALRQLAAVISDRKPDIVHSWLFAGNAYARLAVGRNSQPKVVVSERCVDVWKSGWQLWIDRKLIPRTDWMVANSEPVAGFYRGLGFPADRLSVIHNGVAAPDAAERPRASLFEEFNIPPDQKVVGYVGRLATQKRIKDLLWAFELLLELDPNVTFLIVGDGPERENLERFARQIRVEDQVRFTGHRLDAASLIPHFDVFWLASDFEGQSNSLMEAMASGVPVVASDIAPNLELVTHEETGLIVPTGDRPEFTKAAARLLREPETANRLGMAARARMQSDFSVQGMIDAHVDLYRRLLAGKCTSRGLE